MATRAGRDNREYNVLTLATAAAAYENAAASLFRSSIRIDGVGVAGTEEPKSDYITGILLNYGKIARHKVTGVWLPFDGIGTPNAYGLYKKYRLFSESSGKAIKADAEEVEIYRANPQESPLFPFIRLKARLLAEFERAKVQNLNAVKQMSLIVTQSEETAKKLQILNKKRENGAAVGILERALTDLSELNVLKTGAEFMLDRLQAGARKEWEEMLHFVGVYTPREKGERKITDEIGAENSEVDALSNITVKTFNEDCIYNGTADRYRAARVRYDGGGAESRESTQADESTGEEENAAEGA